MKRKRSWKKWLVYGIAFLIIAIIFINPFRQSDFDAWQEEVSYQDYLEALELMKQSEYITRFPYVSFLESMDDINYSLLNHQATMSPSNVAVVNNFSYTGTKATDMQIDPLVAYQVTVPTAGLYHIQLDYFVKSQVLNNLTVSLKVNGQFQFDDSRTIDIPLYWQDDSKDFVLDTYGDESLPNQQRVIGWVTHLLYNNTYTTTDPLLFYFEAGVNTIEIENILSGAILLGDVELVAPRQRMDYATYIEQYSSVSKAPTSIFINATEYTQKNSSYVRLYAFQSPSVTPYGVVDKKLNVINGAAWYRSGHEVTYSINVLETGLYNINLHYLNDKIDYSVFRSIAINGVIPFEELAAYEFKLTGPNVWRNEILGDSSGAFDFYLTEGINTITLRVVTEPLKTGLRDIQLMIDHINGFALNILKITGSNIDISRKWQFTNYIPQTPAYLQAYETIIKYQVVQMSQYSSKSDLSAALAYLKTAVTQLDKIQKEPDKIPIYLGTLYSGVGSITQMLGDSLSILQSQPMYLNYLYFSNDKVFGPDNANIFQKLGSGIRSFTSSFTQRKYVTFDDPEAINIWVNRSLIYVDLMQKMADQAFGNTDVKIKISIMPDANKLILANAAGATPDIALGLPSYMPFDLAIRGALQDMSEFDDFWGLADKFSPGAFIPYILEDGVYAMPETLEFHALVYRTDTMRALGLNVPNTWNDVINMLPTLQRFGMNFYYPTSGGASLKWFYQTSPLIYQNGGTIYNADGLSTSINSEASFKGLKLLADLYTTYSLPSYVASFYNSFRYNTLPIGIIDFGTYLTLKNAAPELTGGWELALYPGVENTEGEIQRWYIANGTAAIMFKESDPVKKNQSWEFMKWWLSSATQTEFAFLLQSTYGPEFVWLSGNLDAVADSPIDSKDLTVILEQIKWLVDVPRTPGQYMLERGLSDIWNKVTFDGVPIRVAIDNQVLRINREINKKMIEFGYLDAEGNILTPYTVRDTAWVRAQIAAYLANQREE
ncbi:MAG: extracellular solute-binding protein [bacterium]|nr:extracellular solute-binding protein [bacterium]